MTFESALAKRRQQLLDEIKSLNTTKERKFIAQKQLNIIERDMGRMSIEIKKEETSNNILTYPTY